MRSATHLKSVRDFGEHGDIPVTANLTDGVLEIKIPRVEDKRTVHNITIK